ncbi:MAG TPA: 2-aminoethylphosphonate--pyruvate transaminase [Verrucomicrobia bacterium]|nr:2-aminoethylphosphonate--pyruvate transaminase [Verrucomicrobiota bacterium]
MAPPDKLLFTPGPLTTSRTVKEAMLRDVGSRDEEFISLVRDVRRRLLELGGVSQERGYEAVLMQGSGTFGVEAVLSSAVPPNGKLLVAVNGAYGERMVRIAARHGIACEAMRISEDQPIDPDAVRQFLRQHPDVTHVALVHSETTTGMLNPVEAVGGVAREAGRTLIVDAMSSFGAIPLNVAEAGIDFLVSSANKCIEGVPGFSFVLARREALNACAGRARTLSLDLHEQWKGLETNGQFRFTPPTHALLAFAQALRELDAEGGVAARAKRYQSNHRILVSGMKELGFVPYLKPAHQGPVITAFRYPDDKRFLFDEFYAGLSRAGMVIYPGKLSSVDCFRIGNIGRLYEKDIRSLLEAVKVVIREMGMPVPVPPPPR